VGPFDKPQQADDTLSLPDLEQAIRLQAESGEEE